MPWFEIQNKITGSPSVPVYPFSTATDEQITAMLEAVRNGDLTVQDLGWEVGDERTVHLSAMAATGVGESHVEQDQTLVILHGADMFDLVDGGKNLFVIGLKNILANGTTREGGYINSTSTNVGGWENSARRTWCDNVFKLALPSEIQKWFKKFKYKTSDGQTQTTISEMENYFTLAAAYEILGSSNYSIVGENTIRMDYYKSNSNRIKYAGDSSSTGNGYWTRSPAKSNSRYFCYIDGYGSGSSGTDANAEFVGLSPFGCV